MRKDAVVCIKITVLVVLASKRVFRILYEVPWSERVAQRVLDRHASSRYGIVSIVVPQERVPV
jgi:hypothetical protein